MADRNLPISDGTTWGAPSGIQGGTTGGGVQGGGAGYCPVGSVCDRGGGATDPDWYQTGIEASLADARAQMERGEITSTQYYQFELNTLGREGYMDKYPDVYGGGGLPPGPFYLDEIHGEQADLRNLLRQFRGPEATYIRWIIQNELTQLARREQRMRRSQQDLHIRNDIRLGEEEIKEGVTGANKGQDRIDNALTRKVALKKRLDKTPEYDPLEPPMPEWMEEYIDRSMPAIKPHTGLTEQQGRHGGHWAGFQRPEQARALRPLGAQAELTPEEMGFMGGYLGWAKAGSPHEYSEEAVMAMADWQKHWQQHTRLSESLFPKQAKLGQRWTTALQR